MLHLKSSRPSLLLAKQIYASEALAVSLFLDSYLYLSKIISNSLSLHLGFAKIPRYSHLREPLGAFVSAASALVELYGG
jgi:hypothetical protein